MKQEYELTVATQSADVRPEAELGSDAQWNENSR